MKDANDPPCGCGGESNVITRKSFLGRAGAALAAIGLFLAHPLRAGAVWEEGFPCDDPVPDLQFCWEDWWCGRCDWLCFVVWESRDHMHYCGSDVWIMGPC